MSHLISTWFLFVGFSFEYKKLKNKQNFNISVLILVIEKWYHWLYTNNLEILSYFVKYF